MLSSSIEIPSGIETRLVVIQPGAIRLLPDVLETLSLRGANVLCIDDANTHPAAGAQVETELHAAAVLTNTLTLDPDSSGHVPGDREQVNQIVDHVNANDVDLIIGIGSGVINDLGKLTARLTNTRYIAVATAASMNGYGSPIAAIIDEGVKRTLPAAPTDAIIADLDVLSHAPADMTRSGYADLLSKATANTDWLLSHLITGDAYDPKPHEMLEPIVLNCRSRAAAIGNCEPSAMDVLMQGLIYGGFAMTLAGRSTPASGGEHLISHYWDMLAHQRGEPHALHGFQVAIGTRLCLALYERLLAIESINVDTAKRTWQPWDTRREALQRVHGSLFEIIESEAKAQQLTRDEHGERIERIANNWSNIRETLVPMLQSEAQMKAALKAANVPLHVGDIGRTRREVRHALCHAADVRARYTVLDLASSLDVLELWADDMLDQCKIY